MKDYYAPNKNWFQRNWKWFVPSGCLGLIVIFVLLALGIFAGVNSAMKSSDVYKHSMEVSARNKQVINEIGTGLENDEMISGSISTTNYSGEASMDIPVKGSKGKGLIHVETKMQNKIWTYHVLNFYPEGSTEPINLLEENQ